MIEVGDYTNYYSDNLPTVWNVVSIDWDKELVTLSAAWFYTEQWDNITVSMNDRNLLKD